MGQPKEARLTPEIAQQICERTASAAVLEGSIARVGSQYVIGPARKGLQHRKHSGSAAGGRRQERGCPELSQRDVAQIQNQGGRIAGYRGTALDAARRGHDIVNRSLESLQHGNESGPILRDGRGHTFLPASRRNRSEFRDRACAVWNVLYSASGESVLSAESTTKAWLLRERVSDRERFYIDFTYDRHVTGNLEKAYQTLELWVQTYPRRGGGNADPRVY